MDLHPDVYEEEIHVTPWITLLRRVAQRCAEIAPARGRLLDAMCGTGTLCREIHALRSDLYVTGVDNDVEVVSYANTRGGDRVRALHGDILEWQPEDAFDIITCTGGLHHVSPSSQPALLDRFRRWLKPGGRVILADPLIGEYGTERERQANVLQLGAAYIAAGISGGGSTEVLSALADILRRDLEKNEWKRTLSQVETLLSNRFVVIEQAKVWPNGTAEYGDYYFVLESQGSGAS